MCLQLLKPFLPSFSSCVKNFKYHAFFRVISKYLLFIFGVYYSHISTSGIAGTLKDVWFLCICLKYNQHSKCSHYFKNKRVIEAKKKKEIKEETKNTLVGFHSGFSNQVALLRLVCPALRMGMLEVKTVISYLELL